MTHSEQINEIASALAKAQGKIENAVKAAENPGFKRGNKAATYADLSSVWDACREHLSAAGVAVVQSPQTEGAVVTIETLLTHSSGQWIKGSLSASAADARPQSVGSAITYLRRYALASMVGVAPADDDGEAAEGRPDTGAGRRQSSEDAAAKLRANRSQVADPKARTQAVLSQFVRRWGTEARKQLGQVIGRTIPASVAASEIVLSEDELRKAEAASAIGDAHDVGARN